MKLLFFYSFRKMWTRRETRFQNPDVEYDQDFQCLLATTHMTQNIGMRVTSLKIVLFSIFSISFLIICFYRHTVRSF